MFEKYKPISISISIFILNTLTVFVFEQIIFASLLYLIYYLLIEKFCYTEKFFISLRVAIFSTIGLLIRFIYFYLVMKFEYEFSILVSFLLCSIVFVMPSLIITIHYFVKNRNAEQSCVTDFDL